MELIQIIAEKMSHYASVEKVILFGSRARGDFEERSDVDVAILCPGATDEEWLQMELQMEEIPTLLKIDLVRLDTAAKSLQDVVNKEGIIVYERK